ncbi:MAG: ribonuclease H [Bacteroidota bacterium]
MSRRIIAWDIETVPQPLDSFSYRQQRRHDLMLNDEARRTPEADRDDLSRKVRSLHPMLGWICCISCVRLGAGDQPAEPKSYTAHLRGHESGLLSQFWADIAKVGPALWVTYNGKRFDADWLRVRSAAHGIVPSRRDILDRYPFRHEPHCDLSRVFDCRSGLDDLCDLLGVTSPKGEMHGGIVAEAVAGGRIEDVAAYCEADVRATLECYVRLRGQL